MQVAMVFVAFTGKALSSTTSVERLQKKSLQPNRLNRLFISYISAYCWPWRKMYHKCVVYPIKESSSSLYDNLHVLFENGKPCVLLG